MINLSGVEHRYTHGERDIVLSLKINKGEFVCVTGKAGAGKTTFLKLLTGEQKACAGTVCCLGRDLGSLSARGLALYRRETGIIFQDRRLLPGKTVAANAGYVLEAAGIGKKEAEGRVRRVLELTGLQHKGHCLPGELSGDEQQRAAAARAIVNKPRLLLADEPAAGLDDRGAEEIMQLLHRLHAEGTTVLMTAHRPVAAGNRIIELKKGRVALDTGRRRTEYDPLHA
ncbi:MAG: ATP-binding cassette domain-containing protein [Alkalicoccus sp.]|nr:MAG: ATP-binding cassette domain-containing protein [Alkalicoccus sp.]